MIIGKLNKRVTIQRLTKAVNPFAVGADDSWTTIATVWAAVGPLTAKEVFQVTQANMKVTHKITIRYPGTSFTVGANDRLVYKGRNFEVQTGIVNELENDIQLDIMAYEINPVL